MKKESRPTRFIIRLAIFLLSFYPRPLLSGLDRFTPLDKVDNWIIEQRIDSRNYFVRCRASVASFYNWFGQSIYLDSKDQLVVPDEFADKKNKHDVSINKVKTALERCRSGVLYLPE